MRRFLFILGFVTGIATMFVVSCHDTVSPLSAADVMLSKGKSGECRGGGRKACPAPPDTTTPPEPAPPEAPPPGDGTVARACNFDGGTLCGFGTWTTDVSKIAVIDDPTGSGRGKVARLKYAGGPGDDNTSLVQPTANGPPDSEAALHIGAPGRFYEFDFYIPPELTARMQGDPSFGQKLIYIKESQYKHPDHRFAMVVGIMGTELGISGTFRRSGDDYERVYTYLPLGLTGGQWRTLKVYLQRESAKGVRDGVLTVWLDGVQLFHNATMRWSLESWSTPAGELYMDNVLIGQQVNTLESGGAYDTYRLIDNVSIKERH